MKYVWGIFLALAGGLFFCVCSVPGTCPGCSASVRFVAVGDFGTGGPDQYRVAQAMQAKCAAAGCDFGLLLGDNFYADGVESATDAQFQTKFEMPYAPLGIPFYAVMGNHDYGNVVAALGVPKAQYQVDYSKQSRFWRMPAQYYAFARPPVNFLALDTSLVNAGVGDRQAELAEKTWAGEKSPWRIAFGHQPYFNNGKHGDAEPKLRAFLEQHVCGRADFYFSGHDHSRQFLKPECNGTKFIISGGGGVGLYPLNTGHETRFQSSSFGFLWAEATRTAIHFEFVNDQGQTDFETSFKR